MDIRKFFGKAGDSNKKKPTAAKRKPAANAAASTSSATSAAQSEKRQRVEVSAQDFFGNQKKKYDNSLVEVTEEEATPKKEESSPSPAKKQKQEEQPDEDIQENESNVKEELKKESSAKKRRLVIEEDDDDDDEEEEVVPPKPAPAKKTKRNAIQEEEEDDDDDHKEDEEEEEDEEDEEVKAPAKKAPPKKAPAKKPAPKKSAPKKEATPKKSKKEQHKESLLQPTLKLKTFAADSAVPECLLGTTFVFTGVLDDLSRESAEDFVKTLGGRVTTAVSGKTDYLVVGDLLEDGRPYTEGSKYRKAMENDVIVVKGEQALYGLVKLYNDKAKAALPAEKVVPMSTAPAAAPAPAKMPANPYAKKPANPYAKKKPANPYASNPYAKSAPKKEEPMATESDHMSLWSDKYAPKTTRDILGNQENVKKLTNWLNRWEQIFNTPKAQGKTFSSPNGPWKAALLSGPPGIGKTTSAMLVTQEAGRDTLELNASDARSKKALSEGLGDVTGSQVLSFKPAKVQKKRCIIMDEVDGMGAGDRSGMAELIKMIKGSKVPIICICNDRQSQKVKSLAPYCMDLRFRRPTKSVIGRRAIRIGNQEGMRIEQNAAEAIAESCGNDIRQVLNSLQMWSSKEGQSLTYKDLKERQSSINKDEILRVSMFDATKLIIEGRKGLAGADAKAQKDSLYKRSDAFFVDYSLMGLNVHQNYPKVLIGQYTEAKRANDEDVNLQFLERMHDATHAMSDYAVAEHAIRSGDQNWGLLPFCAMLAVKTGYHAGGENGGFLPGFPEFAGWMGKNSTRGKKTRLLQELHHHMNYKVSGDSQEIRMSYIPVLRERFSSLLIAEGGAPEAIAFMDEYGLDRDDVFENLDEFQMGKNKSISSLLDSKQKSAFTRAYNEGSHKSQALVAEQGGGGKGRKKAARSASLDPMDPDVVDDDKKLAESEDERDEEDDKAMEMFKKKSAKRAAAKKRKSKGKKK